MPEDQEVFCQQVAESSSKHLWIIYTRRPEIKKLAKKRKPGPFGQPYKIKVKGNIPRGGIIKKENPFFMKAKDRRYKM